MLSRLIIGGLVVLLLASLHITHAKLFKRGGGGTGGVAPSGVLLPLTGNSLVTTSSGTLTFAGSHDRYGYDVLKNGSPANIPAVAICNGAVVAGALICASSGPHAYFKYNTNLPSPWPSTDCLVDGYTVTTTLTAPTGTFIDPGGAVWAWGAAIGGGQYFISRNGSAVPADGANTMYGETMSLWDDGSVFVRRNAAVWYVYVGAQFVGWSKGSPANAPSQGLYRKAAKCPAGL